MENHGDKHEIEAAALRLNYSAKSLRMEMMRISHNSACGNRCLQARSLSIIIDDISSYNDWEHDKGIVKQMSVDINRLIPLVLGFINLCDDPVSIAIKEALKNLEKEIDYIRGLRSSKKERK